MLPKTVRRGRILVVLQCLGFIFCFNLTGLATVPEAVPTSPTASVLLDFVPQAPEISKLIQHFSSYEKAPSRLLFRYYHPVIQELVYSHQHAGPSGLLRFPEGRCLENNFLYIVSIAGEQRSLIPNEKDVVVRTSIQPGKITERWSWPDGIVLTRVYFQTEKVLGTGVRCTIHNQSKRSLKGVRFGVHIQEPEVVDCLNRKSQVESDDELIADPRDAVLFQRDYLVREENWIAHGWNLEGGFIKAGENIQVQTNTTDHRGLIVDIETPAKDLERGQLYSAIFYSAWGLDRESVANQMQKLRKADGFHQWETDNQQHALRGMALKTENQELGFYFQMLKTWAGWMAFHDQYGVEQINSLYQNRGIAPEKLLLGIEGLLALDEHHRLTVKHYLDYWLDQRIDTIDLAFVLLIACRYYQLTQDEQWFALNAHRIIELAKYFSEMDQDDDGLPEYPLSGKIYPGYYSVIPEGSALRDKSLEFVKNALVSVSALREMVKLLGTLPNSEIELGEAWKEKLKRAETSLEKKFWYPTLGYDGYYAFAKLRESDFKLPVRSLDVYWALLEKIGSQDLQKKVFNELWSNSNWRDRYERYNSYIYEQVDFPLNAGNGMYPNFFATQAILTLGLADPITTEVAHQRLRDYLEGVVYQPSLLAMPGCDSDDRAGLCIANLNFIKLILKGLCGLEMVQNGLKITLPSSDCQSPLEIKNIHFRKTKVNFSMKGKGARGRILVNGSAIKSGTVISNDKLNVKSLDIQIIRKPAKKTQRTRKKPLKTRLK